MGDGSHHQRRLGYEPMTEKEYSTSLADKGIFLVTAVVMPFNCRGLVTGQEQGGTIPGIKIVRFKRRPGSEASQLLTTWPPPPVSIAAVHPLLAETKPNLCPAGKTTERPCHVVLSL